MRLLLNNRRILLLFILLLSMGAISGCGGGSSSVPPTGSDPVDPPVTDNEDGNDDDGNSEPLACNSAIYSEAMNLRIYQVMTEAFIDGDASIGYGVGYGPSHHGGDIRGIINSLDYIKALGFNAIWLTPVFDSIALPSQDLAADRLDATGYYASNFFAIDPNFGSLADARELVDTAHAKGLYVIFDGVFGHFKNNAHQYPSPGGRVVSQAGPPVAGIGRLAQYPDDLEFFKEVASYWVKELKIDGWRLDQAYQVPLNAWVDIRGAVVEAAASVTYTNSHGDTVNPLGYMVAEIWKGEGDIAAEAYGSESHPALCSAFDFPMRYALVQALAVEESGAANPTAARLRNGFNTHDTYPAHALPNGFLGNHDLLRFGDLIQRAGIADPADAGYWLRHKAAYSFLTAYSGPITLYYGEEIGQEVPDYADQVIVNCADQGLCDDHVARTSGKIEGLPSGTDNIQFEASEQQAELRDYLSKLMIMRAQQPALYKGTRTSILTPANVANVLYADYKAYENEAVIYLLNLSDEPLNTRFTACALGATGELTNLLTDEVIRPDQTGDYAIEIDATAALFLKVAIPQAGGPGCALNESPIGTGPLANCNTPDASGNGPLATDMFIRGNYTGGENFAATPANRQFRYKGDNLYQVVVTETAASRYGFKFASADWSAEYAVANGADVILGTEQPMAPASGFNTESFIDIEQPSDYVFSFLIDDDLNGGVMMVSQCAE
ncbi:MAG TPA: alpha-amylase family glycosyl hydrolase [Cellvibrionaceae bacterium]